jgi:hypothetical protein
VSKDRPDVEIQVLSSRGFFLSSSEASKASNVATVSDRMSELLVSDVSDAAEVNLLEMLGARVSEASLKRARELTSGRARTLEARSPYGFAKVPIREQFVELVPGAVDAPAVVEIRYPRAFLDATEGIANPSEGGGVRELVLAERTVQGVRLKRGDRLFLPSDKGRAFVVTSTDPEVVLQRPVVLRISRQLSKTSQRRAWRLTGAPVASDVAVVRGLRPGDEVLWTLSGPEKQSPVLGVVVSASSQAIVVDVPAERMEAAAVAGRKNVRNLVETKDWLHPLSRCSSDPTVPTRTLCEARKDGGVWDRPCEHDLDCPYFEAASGRGGCLGGGMCEVPLGVRRVGFRHADSRSAPALCWERSSETGLVRAQGYDRTTCLAAVFPSAP